MSVRFPIKSHTRFDISLCLEGILIIIIGDRITIQCNDTEDSIVSELVEMGIPQEKIDLNFIHPQHRELETDIERLENATISRTH